MIVRVLSLFVLISCFSLSNVFAQASAPVSDFDKLQAELDALFLEVEELKNGVNRLMVNDALIDLGISDLATGIDKLNSNLDDLSESYDRLERSRDLLY